MLHFLHFPAQNGTKERHQKHQRTGKPSARVARAKRNECNCRRIAAERTAASLGRTYRVLCEEHHDDGTVFGRTEANIGITFPADGSVVGRFAQVRVTKALNWVLEGEAVSFE